MGSHNARLKLDSYGTITPLEERLKIEVETLISYLRGITAPSIQNHERTVCEAFAVRLWESLKKRRTMGMQATQAEWREEISDNLSNG